MAGKSDQDEESLKTDIYTVSADPSRLAHQQSWQAANLYTHSEERPHRSITYRPHTPYLQALRWSDGSTTAPPLHP